MDYKEIHGDLFKLPENYYLCHCISSDFKLGLGIAAEFDKHFDMRRKLFSKYQPNVFKPCALLVDNVFNLVTKEKYWYKGLGTLLMEEALKMAREMGYEQVELGVYNDNPRAKSMYERFGFEEWGIMKKAFKLKDRSYRDEIMMGKEI